MLTPDTALMIVDMQKYYLSEESSYYHYFTHLWPDSMDYILTRCRETVIPNIQRLYRFFQENSCPVVFLRLCSSDEERRDLHRFFRETNEKGRQLGFHNIYPLASDPMAEIIDEFRPDPDDKNCIIIDKTTYSAFTSTQIAQIFKDRGIQSLVFTGLATSQCVETTARDASDHGFTILHIEDAQADYDDISHNSSLYSSQGVCGGIIYDTNRFLDYHAR